MLKLKQIATNEMIVCSRYNSGYRVASGGPMSFLRDQDEGTTLGSR